MEQKADIITLIRKERFTYVNDIFPQLLVDSNGVCISDASKVYPFPNEEQVIDLPDWVNVKFLNQDMEQILLKKLKINNGRRELVSALSKYNLEEYSFDRLLRGIVKQVDDDLTSVDKCSDILKWLWKYYNLEDRQPISDVKVKVICRDGRICYAKECYIGREYGNDLGERLISLFSDNFVAFNELKIECGDATSVIGFLEWLGVSKYPRLEKKSLINDEIKEFLPTCYPLYVQRDNCQYSREEFSNIRNVEVGFFENLDLLLNKANFNDLLAWFILDDEINSRINTETEGKNSFACITGWPGKKQDVRYVVPSCIKSYLRYFLSNIKWIPNDAGEKAMPSYCCFEDNALDPFIIVPSIDYGYLKNITGRNCKKDVEAILSHIGVADVFQEMKNTVVYETLMRLKDLDNECKKGKGLYRKIIRDGYTQEEYKKDNLYYDEFVKNGYVLAKKNGIKQYVPVSEARYADKKVFSAEILKSFSMFDVDARSGEEKIKNLFGVKPLKYTNVETDGKPEIHPLDEAFKREYLRFIPFVYACRMGLKNANSDFRKLKSSKVTLCSNITIKYKFGEEYRISCLNEYETVYLRKNNTAYICVPEKYVVLEMLKQVFEFADAVAELITAILDVNEDKDFFRDLFRESDLVREKKMRLDKGDDNLELLTAARSRFNCEIDLRDEFWMAIAEILHIPDSEAAADKLINILHLEPNVDLDIKYEDLNHFDNVETIISIFKELGIDIDKYNVVANHPIDISKYWANKLKEKMNSYKSKYQAYLIDKLKADTNCVKLYDQYYEEYTFIEPTIANSISVDINSVLESECGVSFEVLDAYSDSLISTVIDKEKEKLSLDELQKICKLYSQAKIDAYLIFGRIEDLLNPKGECIEDKTSEPSIEQTMKTLVEEIFSTPLEGFSEMNTQAVEVEIKHDNSKKQRKHYKKIYLESSDRKKQEIGIIGEACVFKELQNLYLDARWVSGNAEKAGYILKGDDTCGYDIKYTDSAGVIQYVEVKASRNEDVIFSLSDSELRFGCQNSSCYEIIYVVIGDDGKPQDKPWRLGHIFEFTDGEDLLHNDRFSIKSDSYSVVAKPVAKNE